MRLIRYHFLKVVILLAILFSGNIYSQVFVGDSATIFISKNSDIYIAGDIDNQYVIVENGSVIRSKNDKTDLKKEKRSKPVLVMASSQKKSVNTSKAKPEKVNKINEAHYSYKPQESSTFFVEGNGHQKNLLLPSSSGNPILGILPSKSKSNFLVEDVETCKLVSIDFTTTETSLSFSIRPPPVLV